ncbi:HAD-like domain-containing protein [Bombardia bombarda]|uniref:HAD-like domain-containing protein n=1 Tax=Bombardia bombarda TaxID=252184 RepID=A0AA39XM83_9PEZI|nr:HAD-like domain-containing protein [Bombardia bombarda]
MSTPTPSLSRIKALIFDVFGTCVDWRSSVVSALETAYLTKKKDSSLSLPSTDPDWPLFAQQWRSSYGAFTRSFIPGTTPWKDIDTHHRDSLVELLRAWRLDGLYTPAEIESLSKVWHFLRPWPDSSTGLHALGKGKEGGLGLVVATLSNGNHALLADLDRFGNLGFERLISAEDFKAYKPNPATYLGACELLGFAPGEVVMVAAHLGDLAAARGNGLRTVYVEREGEEEWGRGDERYREAKGGWVDLWVGGDEEGFVEVARRLEGSLERG